MSSIIRAPKDFWIGAIYLAAGATGFIVGREYSFGSSARMGPGYFPTVVSSLLIVFGVLAIARSFITGGPAIGSIPWKALILVTGSVCTFAFLLNTAGFVVAVVIMALLSAAASEKFRLESRALLGLAALVVLCALVFIKGLGVPMPLVGSWLQPMILAWLGS